MISKTKRLKHLLIIFWSSHHISHHRNISTSQLFFSASFPPIHLFDESALPALTCREALSNWLVDLKAYTKSPKTTKNSIPKGFFRNENQLPQNHQNQSFFRSFVHTYPYSKLILIFFFLKKPAYYISHIHPYPSSSPISNPNLISHISHFSLFPTFSMSDSDFYTMSVPSYPVSRSIHLLAYGLFVVLFCTDGFCRLRCASSCANVWSKLWHVSGKSEVNLFEHVVKVKHT